MDATVNVVAFAAVTTTPVKLNEFGIAPVIVTTCPGVNVFAAVNVTAVPVVAAPVICAVN